MFDTGQLPTEGHAKSKVAVASSGSPPPDWLPNRRPHSKPTAACQPVTNFEQVGWGASREVTVSGGRTAIALGFYPVPRFGHRHWDHRGWHPSRLAPRF